MVLSSWQLFRQVWKNIYANKYTYLANATLLQVFMVFVGSFLLSTIFKGALLVTGHANLTKDTFVDILTNPLGLFFIIIFLLIMALLIFLEFSILTLNVYGNSIGRFYSLKETVINALKKWRLLVGPQLIFFILYCILMIPLANLGMGSILTESLYIPKFISGELMKSTSGMCIYWSVILVCIYINIRLFFVLPLSMINEKNIWYNIKKSWAITRENKVRIAGSMLIFGIILFLIFSLFIIIVSVSFYFFDSNGENLIVQTMFYTFMKVLLFSTAVFSKIAIITNLILVIIEKDAVGIDFKNKKEVDHDYEEKRKSKWLVTFLILLTVGGVAFNSITLYAAELNSNVKIIGHRGYIAKGVENSLESLEAAAKANVDFVEVDILLTKDNKFVVMHDYNLKRLAKIDKRVQDMTFDEVVGLEIEADGYRSKIPSFDEFVAKAEQLNIKLLVELKPHGAEPSDYPQLFVDKMRSLGVQYKYKAMSLETKVMEDIESLAPEIVTGTVIPLQYGKFKSTTTDFFVIEDFSYRASLVEQAKEQGKEVFVWTINEREQIIKYLHSDVDGIITDEPELVYEEKIDLKENNNYFKRALNMI